MKKVFLVVSLLMGISFFNSALANNGVSVITYTVSNTVGNFEHVSEYAFIDFNGNGCRDQWETTVLIRSYELEFLDDGGMMIHEW